MHLLNIQACTDYASECDKMSTFSTHDTHSHTYCKWDVVPAEYLAAVPLWTCGRQPGAKCELVAPSDNEQHYKTTCKRPWGFLILIAVKTMTAWNGLLSLTTSFLYLDHCGYSNIFTSFTQRLHPLSRFFFILFLEIPPNTEVTIKSRHLTDEFLPPRHLFFSLSSRLLFLIPLNLCGCCVMLPWSCIPPWPVPVPSQNSDKWEREREKEQSRGLKLATMTNGQTSREGGPVRSLPPERLVASTQPLHGNLTRNL